MFWILLALLAGAAKTGKSLTTKYATEVAGQYAIAFSIRSITATAVAVPAFLTWTITTDRLFWVALIANAIALAAATVTATRAFKYGDVSIVSPLIGLVPLAILFPSVLVFGDNPSPAAVVGIVLVAFGGYTLELDDLRSDFFGPIKALASNKGARYALLTVLIVMFVPNLDQIGIERTNPYVWTFVLHVVTSALIAPLLLRDDAGDKRYTRWWALALIGVGGANAAIFLLQSFAYQLTIPVYVIAVKRLNLIASVYLGSRLFGEPNLRSRLTGTLLIVVGVVVISLASVGII